MQLVEVAARTDVGQVRDHNEDAFLTLEEIGLIAVADGMGGLSHGGLASSTAVSTLRAAHDALDQLVVDVDESPTATNRRQLAQALEFLAQLAARTIQQSVQGRPSGTTLVAGAVAGGHLLLCHVGDSRAYLIRQDEIRPLTEDHTVAAARVRAGVMSPDEHDDSPLQHILYQALGTSGEPDPDLLDVELAAGDLVLLCSDGLCGLISDEAILEQIRAHSTNLEASAEALIDAANGAGGRDNITVVLARVHEGEEPEAVEARTTRLETSPLLAGLSATEQSLLALYLDHQELEPEEEIAAADGLQFILSGRVVDSAAQPREVVGLLGLCGPAEGTVQVQQAATVARLSAGEFEELQTRRPALAAKLLRATLIEVQELLAAGTPTPL